MKLELNIRNTENVGFLSDDDVAQIDEVLNALITVGGLTRVKGGSTIIHFDHEGKFSKIELKYYPWYKKK